MPPPKPNEKPRVRGCMYKSVVSRAHACMPRAAWRVKRYAFIYVVLRPHANVVVETLRG